MLGNSIVKLPREDWMYKGDLLETIVSLVPDPNMSLVTPEPVTLWEMQPHKPRDGRSQSN